MSYTIEITHANDMIREEWKVVERLDHASEIEEHLASPNFEWSEGTCVRVMSNLGDAVYVGIYNADTLVDVGPESEITERFDWMYNEAASGYLRAYGWMDSWKYCNEPAWMLEAVALLVDKKMIIRCAAEIMVFANDNSNDSRKYIRNATDAVHDYSTGRLEFTELSNVFEELPQRIPSGDYLLGAVKSLAATTLSPGGAMDVAYLILSFFIGQDTELEYAEAKNRISDIVRKYIPFYEIAKAITKP